MQVFLCGPLTDPALLRAVLGHDPLCHAANVTGWRMVQAQDGALAGLLRASGDVAGRMAELGAGDLARLDFCAASLGLTPDCAETGARIYTLPQAGPAAPDWIVADWALRWAPTLRATVASIMALYGTIAPETLAARLSMLLVAGGSRARAEQHGPTTLRRAMAAGDVQVDHLSHPYARFFATADYRLRHRRFDGEMSDTLDRAAFISGDAVTVLPYDPQRDRVLLVEQFRMGPLARGDVECWQLEAIAGRIDAGEMPEAAAAREAVEEAGLTLGPLHKVAEYYPSPGAYSEYLYSYVALADLPDTAAGLFGELTESEDIRAHVISFDHLVALMAGQELTNAPLLLTVQWLQAHRQSLRDFAAKGAHPA